MDVKELSAALAKVILAEHYLNDPYADEVRKEENLRKAENLLYGPSAIPPAPEPGAEIERNGEWGIYLYGYVATYNLPDSDRQIFLPGSFSTIGATYFAQDRPPILSMHGKDPLLKDHPLGYALAYDDDDKGLYLSAWIPRMPDASIQEDKAALHRWAVIYNFILRGSLRGFSVGGNYHSEPNPDYLYDRRKIRQWTVSEISVVWNPSQPLAVFRCKRT